MLFSTIEIALGYGIILLTTFSERGALELRAYNRAVALATVSIIIAAALIFTR